MARFTEYTSERKVTDQQMGKHDIRVNIDVEAGSSEDAKEKADAIGEAVYEALDALE